MDKGWRRRAVDGLDWEGAAEGTFLDACAGTFDLSLELTGRTGFQGRVVASDFAFPMLLEGIPKLSGSPVAPVCNNKLYPIQTLLGMGGSSKGGSNERHDPCLANTNN